MGDTAESEIEKSVREKLLSSIGEAVDHPPAGQRHTASELLALAQAFALATRRSGRSGPGGPWGQGWKMSAEKGTPTPS